MLPSNIGDVTYHRGMDATYRTAEQKAVFLQQIQDRFSQRDPKRVVLFDDVPENCDAAIGEGFESINIGVSGMDKDTLNSLDDVIKGRRCQDRRVGAKLFSTRRPSDKIKSLALESKESTQ